MPKKLSSVRNCKNVGTLLTFEVPLRSLKYLKVELYDILIHIIEAISIETSSVKKELEADIRYPQNNCLVPFLTLYPSCIHSPPLPNHYLLLLGWLPWIPTKFINANASMTTD